MSENNTTAAPARKGGKPIAIIAVILSILSAIPVIGIYFSGFAFIFTIITFAKKRWVTGIICILLIALGYALTVVLASLEPAQFKYYAEKVLSCSGDIQDTLDKLTN